MADNTETNGGITIDEALSRATTPADRPRKPRTGQKRKVKRKPSEAGRRPKAKSKTAKRRRSPAARLGRALLLILDIIAGIALLVSGYAGVVSPLKYSGIWGILGLTFPIVLWSTVLLFILQLFFHRRGAAWLAAFMILCSGPILTYCPINFNFGKSSESTDSTFTLLSYNVANLRDMRGAGYDSTYNQTISYILSTDADIVCLSESAVLSPNRETGITPSQYDSLSRRYPHIIISGIAQATLSKYPLRPIHVITDHKGFGNGDFGLYHVEMPGGKLVTLINCHLQSLGLNRDDKDLYMDLTKFRHDNVDSVKSQLLKKIAVGNVARARQTQVLLRLIRHYGGPNVIICGDFNDVPGCYSIRNFEDADFKSVYPEVGLGPIITFNANRFYFCIDHVLYRGDMEPLSISKGTTKVSDHYPLLTTFKLVDK